MSHHITKQSVLFKDLSKKAVIAKFDQDYSSSDGGAVLLKACDERLQLSATLTACLSDKRKQSNVTHSLRELFQQRMFGIACGYVDGNDAARLRNDPVMKMLAGRDPIEGGSLASQPTLSRFENAVRQRHMLWLSEALAEAVIARHKRRKKRVRRITIDLDPTVDPTHGLQQLTLFNSFYDTSCYLPLAGFLTFDDEVEQYLFCYVLRPGKAVAKHGCTGLLKRLLPRLRQAFPGARLQIRLDGGFSGPELFEFFEAEKLDYVVGMAQNPRLVSLAEPLMADVRTDFEALQQTTHRYSECAYQARSWPHERRVIIKAEVTAHFNREPKDNPRFVVTNLKTSPQHVYETVYCARGDAENRLKELKHGLEIDRTSCTSFLANQFRCLMTAAAYVLMQELRLKARRTGCARAQVSTLRLRLLKLGAWFESSVRRIVIHLPLNTPFADDWRRIARSVGAVVT
jgi:hypothetical protein